MYFYSTTGGAGEGGFTVPYHRQNANAAYLRHYGNLLFLKFVVSETKDRAERQQATIEIPICERKLEHWKRHANYEHDVVMAGVDKLKREWSSGRRQAA